MNRSSSAANAPMPRVVATVAVTVVYLRAVIVCLWQRVPSSRYGPYVASYITLVPVAAKLEKLRFGLDKISGWFRTNIMSF